MKLYDLWLQHSGDMTLQEYVSEARERARQSRQQRRMPLMLAEMVRQMQNTAPPLWGLQNVCQQQMLQQQTTMPWEGTP